MTFHRKGFKRRKQDVNLLGNTRGCGGREMNHFSIYYRSWKAERWKDKKNNLRSLKTEIYGCMYGSGATHQKCLTDDNGEKLRKTITLALFAQRCRIIFSARHDNKDLRLQQRWCWVHAYAIDIVSDSSRTSCHRDNCRKTLPSSNEFSAMFLRETFTINIFRRQKQSEFKIMATRSAILDNFSREL